jgi:hypothetical protein
LSLSHRSSCLLLEYRRCALGTLELIAFLLNQIYHWVHPAITSRSPISSPIVLAAEVDGGVVFLVNPFPCSMTSTNNSLIAIVVNGRLCYLQSLLLPLVLRERCCFVLKELILLLILLLHRRRPFPQPLIHYLAVSRSTIETPKKRAGFWGLLLLLSSRNLRRGVTSLHAFPNDHAVAVALHSSTTTSIRGAKA